MQPPALIWEVLWGRLPLRLLAARLGLGFTSLAIVNLYLERTLCSLPGPDGARRSCLISPDLTELGDWSQPHLCLNLSNASFRLSGLEQVTEPPRVLVYGNFNAHFPCYEETQSWTPLYFTPSLLPEMSGPRGEVACCHW